jgi:GIY-YIG catalytic domain
MKGFVYTIRSKSSELVYYGSTVEKMLSNRMASHRTSYKRWLAGKCGKCTSYQIMALGDAYIELVVDVEVETRQHLRALEGKYQRENTCVNIKVEGRTKAEYNSLPKVKAALKAYQATHKEVQAVYAKTPKAKAVQAAYAKTPKAKAARAAAYQKRKALLN